MKVYKIEILVIDFDDIGEDEVKAVIENTSYPNRCINPKVKNIESKSVNWDDDHPLNLSDKRDSAYKELFGA